jgi:hypothetical protein
MSFRRHLSEAFVQALKDNQLWASVCSDRGLQPEIRNDRLTVYYCGQALLRELRFQDGRLTASIHHKFIPLQRSHPSIYVPVAWEDESGFSFDHMLVPQTLGLGDSSVLNAYKRLMKLEAGPEDLLQQEIVSQGENTILDQQVEFPITGYNKIDLCYFDKSTKKMVFAEIKQKDDLRLFGPGEEPEVIAQLKSYGETIHRECDRLVAEFQKVIQLKRELGLASRLEEVPEEALCLEPRPLLVIGNCTSQDVQQIGQAKKSPASSSPWSRLWKQLPGVACGLIVCGPKGCRLCLGKGGQRWRFQ